MSAWFDPSIQPRDWWRALTGRPVAKRASAVVEVPPSAGRPVSALRLLRVTADGRPVYEDAA